MRHRASENASDGCAPWSAYLLECADGSLYCGVAVDVERRLRDHGTPRGARYVRAHGGVRRLLWSQEFPSRTEAMRAELWIKAQPRARKLEMASGRARMPEAALRAPEDRG